MVYHEMIQVATVSYPDDDILSPDSAARKEVRLFVAKTPFNGGSFGESDRKLVLEQSSIAGLLSEAIELHGTSIFPKNCFPPITNASAAAEIQSLVSLRDQYVERFKRLTQLEVRQKVEEADDEEVALGSTKMAGSVSRLKEHKKNKEKIRLELKEVIQALAGIMADHKNVSIADVISEYKNY